MDHPTWPMLNIIKYNVFNNGGDLYGKEPFSYYGLNLFLNLNALAVLGLILAPVLLLFQDTRILVLGGLLHVVLFSSMAHKEERFMAPVYPLLCLNASLVLHKACGTFAPRLKVLVYGLVCIVVGTLGFSRSLALVHFYNAPMELIQDVPLNARSVCYGQDWYRFPSSFLLPNHATKVVWVESDFTGQLPAPFSAFPEGLHTHHSHFNDKNEFVEELVSPLSECEYLFAEWSSALDSRFQTVTCAPMLDVEKTRAPWRSFYVPQSMQKHVYTQFCMFKT